MSDSIEADGFYMMFVLEVVEDGDGIDGRSKHKYILSINHACLEQQSILKTTEHHHHKLTTTRFPKRAPIDLIFIVKALVSTP